ncbi:MAG TPA: EamA family transporter, partial [Reyranellaceae bacterium]|nr:EamA family transporter [Reyranellaceae bacterium]
ADLVELIFVAAALSSALLHAGWNAAVKGTSNPTQAMTAQAIVAALLSLPGFLLTGLPDPASWPWIAASTGVYVVTISALLRGYEHGGFGIVYSVSRAIGVLLVVPLAALFVGDRIGRAALAGVAIIALSLGALAWDAKRDQTASFRALGWTLLAGLGIATYVLCDTRGVRAAGSPAAYGFAVSIGNAIVMWIRQRHLGSPWAQIRDQWRIAVPAGVASTASYLLILWVWNHAPIAPAAALRDTSAVFAILIAIVWLKEPFTRTRIAAVLLAAAAVPLLRLG